MFARSIAVFASRASRQPRGVDFLRNRFTNKGSAFSLAERRHMKLEGLLPPSVESLDDQVERYWEQLTRLDAPINRYQLLRTVLDSNVTLYYAILTRHFRETLPIVYTPTVGEACQHYGDLYQKDHGLYLGVKDIGNVRQLIQNLRKPSVQVIVLTDGSRILGLGDLGANGIGISIGKCSLYVGAGGINPSCVLPVVMDVGTNNGELRNNPLYLGIRRPRCTDDQFYALLDEFMEAAKETWPGAVIQFEDFSNNHCFDMLERYQKRYRCFNDDIQGTGAVISAGLLNALKLSDTPMSEHRILFFGAGSAATGVADSIVQLVSSQFHTSTEELKNQFYLVDTKGLVTTTRGDKLAAHKVPWARTDVSAEESRQLNTLEEVIKHVKPTVLIGLAATGGAFSEEAVRFMSTYCKHPIIFPLSNPSSKAEILPSNAYKWTNGTAIVASGSPFPETVVNGRSLRASQGNNLYIFPGVGLGCAIAQPPYIPQEVLVEAAASLSRMTKQSDLDAGQLYPPVDDIRKVSVTVAVACIEQLQKMGLAKEGLPDNRPELKKLVQAAMWEPRYRDESYYLSQEIVE